MSKIILDEKQSVEELKKELSSKGVKYAMGSYVDVHGIMKSKVVPIDYLEDMMNGSELYTVYALEGMGGDGPQDDECQTIPDQESLVILPWRKDVAWFASDLHYDDEPYPLCSRVILKQQMEKARAAGFEFMLGIEPEFYVFREDEEGNVVPYAKEDTLTMPGYDIRTTLHSMSYLDVMVDYMNALGWEVNSLVHEGGNGQYEFDFTFESALKTADRLTFLRLMAGEVAREHNAFTSFMPKPFSDNFGSGAHHNMSLYEVGTDNNVFVDKNDPRGNGLSKIAYSFIAGLLKHADSLTAISAPIVNSYKRLTPRGMMPQISWAPVYATYGRNNRTAMLRVPKNRPAIENRVPDISANFYLSSALHLAAGLEGIKEGLDPGDLVDYDLYHFTNQELEDHGVKTLPRDLLEAVEAFDNDPLTEEVFGKEFKEEWVKLKKQEWAEHHFQVTEYERNRYLTKY